jgi:hypothetical protein
MDVTLWGKEFIDIVVSGSENDDGSATLVFSSNAAELFELKAQAQVDGAASGAHVLRFK